MAERICLHVSTTCTQNMTYKELRRQIAFKDKVMVKGKKTSSEYLIGTTASQTNQCGDSKHKEAHTVACSLGKEGGQVSAGPATYFRFMLTFLKVKGL